MITDAFCQKIKGLKDIELKLSVTKHSDFLFVVSGSSRFSNEDAHSSLQTLCSSAQYCSEENMFIKSRVVQAKPML
jgi:hypothetical protein